MVFSQTERKVTHCILHLLCRISYVSHGCTGKGNDQVRFELAFYALVPSIKVIAPWRLPEFYNRFAGRSHLLKYAAEKGIPVVQTAAKPWSTDENLHHISYEAGILEEPDVSPPKDMWKLTKDLQEASPEGPQCIDLTFTRGVTSELVIYKPSTEQREVVGKATDLLEIFLQLNSLARAHGIGRIDIVENRFIGVKSRGCYETPAGTILRRAHMDLEGLTLDGKVRALRDSFVTAELSKILYNGYWFSPEREFVQSALEASQKNVNGRVRLSLYKGNVIVEGRASNEGLYDAKESSMDEMGGFEPTDTSGFIKMSVTAPDSSLQAAFLIPSALSFIYYSTCSPVNPFACVNGVLNVRRKVKELQLVRLIFLLTVLMPYPN